MQISSSQPLLSDCTACQNKSWYGSIASPPPASHPPPALMLCRLAGNCLSFAAFHHNASRPALPYTTGMEHIYITHTNTHGHKLHSDEKHLTTHGHLHRERPYTWRWSLISVSVSRGAGCTQSVSTRLINLPNGPWMLDGRWRMVSPSGIRYMCHLKPPMILHRDPLYGWGCSDVEYVRGEVSPVLPKLF